MRSGGPQSTASSQKQQAQQKSGVGLISSEDVKKLQEMGFKTSIIYKAADIAHAEKKNILDVVISLQDTDTDSSSSSAASGASHSQSDQNSAATASKKRRDSQAQNEATTAQGKVGSKQVGASSNNNQAEQSNSQTSSTQQQSSKAKPQAENDVLTIDVRLRQTGTPVGLLNYGNTCYFNSLIQTYFFIPKFIETIMSYRRPQTLAIENLPVERQRRILASINLVSNLQKLFSYMILSDKRYADPKAVLENIVDDQGNRVIMGDQKDIGEFNLQFLERLDEGLKYQEGKSRQPNGSGSVVGGESASGGKKKLEEDSSIMNELFFGIKKEFIAYYSQGEFKHQLVEENVFSPIILDLQYQDLYTSWENHSTVRVEEFKDANGQQTEAEKAGWITKSPEVFMFQIQRVVYKKEIAAAEKLNTPFHFEKEIYADRFLLENRDYILQNKPKLKALKQKRDMIMNELVKLKNYEESKFSIIQIVDMALQFLSKPEKPFEAPVIEEDKFSPQPHAVLRGKNHSTSSNSATSGLDISDFTLDPTSDNLSENQWQVQRRKDKSESAESSLKKPSLDLFSCDGEIPTQPLTPHSTKLANQTIFGEESSSSNHTETQEILSMASSEVASSLSADVVVAPVVGGEQNNVNVLGVDEAAAGQVGDPRIEELNQQLREFNEAKKSILSDSFIQAIDSVKAQTQKLIGSLEMELQKTNEEIESIYESLKKTKYVLHAILIHQGYADSGHYFSYIRSQDQSKWFKFNDIYVSQEDEANVMRQAVGDGKSSAYCLVYVKESRINEAKYVHSFELMGDSINSSSSSNGNSSAASTSSEKVVEQTENSTIVLVKKKQVVIDLQNQENSNSSNKKSDSPAAADNNNNNRQSIQDSKLEKKNHSAAQIGGGTEKVMLPIRDLVSDALKREILGQNRQQQVELQQFKQIQLADSIVENYSKRFAFINEYIRKNYDKTKKLQGIPPMANFGVYLRWNNENVTDLQKVQLLDCAIREISNQRLMLSDLPKQQILHNRLVNNFEGMGEFKSPGKLVLTVRDYEIVNNEYTKFLAKVSCSISILHAFECIFAGETISSLDYLHYTQKQASMNDYFHRMCRDMYKVLLLKASCQLFEMSNEPNEFVLRQIKYILLYSSKLSDGDITTLQIHKIITEFMRHIGQNKLTTSSDRVSLFLASLIDYEKLQEQFEQFTAQQEKYFEDMETAMMEKAMNSDKYFWKIEDVNKNLETQVQQTFAKITIALKSHINFHQNLVKYKNVLDLNDRIENNFQVKLPSALPTTINNNNSTVNSTAANSANSNSSNPTK